MFIAFVKHRRIFYTLSLTLVGVAVFAIFFFGLKFGIDFTGGTILRVEYENNLPSLERLQDSLKEFHLGKITFQKDGKNALTLKMKYIPESTHEEIMQKLGKLGKLKKGSSHFETIGPAIGRELRQKTKFVIISCLLAIVLYIAFSFRRVSKPVNSFVYGLAGLVALGHDIVIPLGIFALLGKFYGVEVTIPVITALLTVFGYSINDSVVVFDRVRENLLRSTASTFEMVVDKSLNQTLTRSLNTSLTTLLVLFSIFFFGGETLKYFSLALILGISFGTYSSMFLATPLLVSYLRKKQRARRR
ncbi:protein translocase subunit SecF [bacterium]|nr:protein translocase subunit SecF [bacterium]